MLVEAFAAQVTDPVAAHAVRRNFAWFPGADGCEAMTIEYTLESASTAEARPSDVVDPNDWLTAGVPV